MTKIFIIRHGQDTDNLAGKLNGHRDTELTELGKRQASEAGSKLLKEKIEVIYVSPLKRTKQTAQIIATALNQSEPIVLPDLIERDFGLFEGKLAVDIPKLTNDFIISDGVNYFLSGDGVETFAQAYERAKSVLEFVKDRHPNQNVLLVTHGDFGKMIRAAYYNWTWKEGIMTPYYANTEVITLN